MIFQSKAVCDAEAGQSLDLNNVAAALAVRLLVYARVVRKNILKKNDLFCTCKKHPLFVLTLVSGNLKTYL